METETEIQADAADTDTDEDGNTDSETRTARLKCDSVNISGSRCFILFRGFLWRRSVNQQLYSQH